MSHPLGRIHKPDSRDWNLADLEKLLPGFDSSKTIDELVSEGRLLSWRDILAFWRWLKGILSPQPIPQPTGKIWSDAVVLDQGAYGTCVGNGWAGWGDCNPIEDHYDEIDARAIYEEATAIDNGKPDKTYQLGASVRSGAKAMQNRKRLSAYAFASSIDEIIQWIDLRGPVVIGSDWDNSMFSPNSKGFVSPDGNVAGGHCYLMLGYDPVTRVFEFRNSWGSGWGQSGSFYMTQADVQTLVFDRSTGEACFAIEV